MSEFQTHLPFDVSYQPEPAATSGLRDEIAQVWGLPLGERVEVAFRGNPIDPMGGVLELAAAPGYPWNPREPLQLRVNGFVFSTREIERWTRL
jgi:hypothetical protein